MPPAHGIGMVFQEQSLLHQPHRRREHLSRQPSARSPSGGLVRWRALYAAARRQLRKVQVDIDPATPTAELDFAARQMVELAKALTLEEQAAGPSGDPARRADLGARAGRHRHPVRARPRAEGARLVRVRLAPPRRGAGAERPRLCHEGRPGGGRARRRRCRRPPAPPAHGRARPPGRVLPRIRAAAVSRRGAAGRRGALPGRRTIGTSTSRCTRARSWASPA